MTYRSKLNNGVHIRRDVYQEVTDTIVNALESGVSPWRKPWKESERAQGFSVPFNAQSGRAYNGINLLLLYCTPYTSKGWLTFKQAKELGGSVRKGEHGTHIVFWKVDMKPDPADASKVRKFFMAREYVVFNVDQCDGIDASRLKLPKPPVAGATDSNAIAANLGARVQHGGNRAFFAPSLDVIQMPSFDAFESSEHYDATLLHELTHWTGHESRLKRDFSGRFGSEAYAFEELVAEIGSAFACAHLGVDYTKLQHASYLANWLKVLKDDKRAIFTAASKAKAACDFILDGGTADSESDESESMPDEIPAQGELLAA